MQGCIKPLCQTPAAGCKRDLWQGTCDRHRAKAGSGNGSLLPLPLRLKLRLADGL